MFRKGSISNVDGQVPAAVRVGKVPMKQAQHSLGDDVNLRSPTPYPRTPDGRYFIVRGRLWRCSNPTIEADARAGLVTALMSARRDKQTAIRAADPEAKEAARQRVDEIKRHLGERGPVWWTDGAPDLNRKLVKNTNYSEWFDAIAAGSDEGSTQGP